MTTKIIGAHASKSRVRPSGMRVSAVAIETAECLRSGRLSNRTGASSARGNRLGSGDCRFSP